MPTDERSIQWYNQHADEYTSHVRNPDESIYHSLYEKPAMYSLLPDLHGKSVVSLGCGSGEDCHYLQQQGAAKVTGIDISESLLKAAGSAYPECDFKLMDMEALAFDDNSFDFAYSSLAIHYIENWNKTFSEAYRVLKPDSYFLFSCEHPVFSAMEITQDDENTKVRQLSRTLHKDTDKITIGGDYLTRRAIVEEFGLAVTTWHKPIGEIAAEATQAGFLIADIHEPKPLPKMQELSPKNYETLIKIPEFIIFKLYKK
jgi:ubiquinone/menaquinone biosynthesis C-methylase UbiE